MSDLLVGQDSWKRCDCVLGHAIKEIEEAREDGYDVGYYEGYEEGYAEGCIDGGS